MAAETVERETVRELARVLLTECRVAAKCFGEAAAEARLLAHREADERKSASFANLADWLEGAERALATVSRHAQDVFERVLKGRAEG
mgnify:CR=1 FL=1